MLFSSTIAETTPAPEKFENATMAGHFGFVFQPYSPSTPAPLQKK